MKALQSSLIASLLLLMGCAGYSSINDLGDSGPIAIAIPVIHDDDDGTLREDLARELSSTGRYRYASTSTRYQLIVKRVENLDEAIDYVWDRHSITPTRVDRLYPSSMRRTMAFSVHLWDCDENKDAVEPFRVSAFTDYNFVNPTFLYNIEFVDVDRKVQTSLQYSFGQLDSQEGGASSSCVPLLSSISKEIVQKLLLLPIPE